MAKSSKDRVSFFIRACLIFLGSHFLIFTSYSSGPNVDLSLGWFELHRHGINWHADNFDWWNLLVVLVLSLIFTWVLEKGLRHRIGVSPG